MTGQAMAMRGRPRKTNVRRDASGKSRGEIVDFAVVLNQPHRRGTEDPSSHLLGYPLGRLRADGYLSDHQLAAGNAWAAVCRGYRAILAAPALSPRSGEMAERVSTGFASFETAHDLDPEGTAKRHAEVREKYNACYETLMQLGLSLGKFRTFAIVMRKVCLEERYPIPDEVGDLRLALNAVERSLWPARK
jgi:hypothetical protein